MNPHSPILVAEDSQDDYVLLDLACRRAGIEIPRFWVRDGIEAKEYLSGAGEFSNRTAHPLPVLILADLKMPRMNGMELLSWVRAQTIIKRIPFVFLTSSAQASDINQAYEQFANSYLVKPSDLDQLAELLGMLKGYWLGLSRLPELR